MTVAIMQPYFIPFAGYFRLFAVADVVVILDCVQFPRTGWVHRNRLPCHSGELRWLTLPIEKADRDVLISNLRFSTDARLRLEASISRFPELDYARRETHPLMARMMDVESRDPCVYIAELLHDIVHLLGFSYNVIFASSLQLDPDLRGQCRIISIARELGAERYINAPGGRSLYEHEAFKVQGIELGFFSQYVGSVTSIVQRLLTSNVSSLRQEILRESVVNE